MEDQANAKPIGAVLSHLPVGRWDAPKPRPEQPLLALHPRLRPLPIEEATMELSRCLTLCAPTGMTIEDRTEWLLVAMDELGDIPGEILRGACRAARLTCDHPAKLVPAIVAYAEPEIERLRELCRPVAPRLVAVPRDSATPEPTKPMTQADVDALSPAMRTIGLGCGALVRNADGSVSPAPGGVRGDE